VRKLQALREARRWSRAELARRAGLNAVTVGLVETGRLRPYHSQVVKIAEALDVPLGDAHRLLDDVADGGDVGDDTQLRDRGRG
jgi:transcriptional regulator with XRE-family HTH domain